jgi:hypothetical protein
VVDVKVLAKKHVITVEGVDMLITVMTVVQIIAQGVMAPVTSNVKTAMDMVVRE